jgi:hypothetical protein
MSSTMGPGVVARLRFGWAHRPYTLMCGIVFFCVGFVEVIVGRRVSNVFVYLDIPSLARVMGCGFILGGAFIFYGILKERAIPETIGLAIIAVCCGMYVVFALLSLGWSGTLVVGGYTILSLGSVRRLVTIARHLPVVGEDD